HQGTVDKTAITNGAPAVVFAHVTKVLQGMGVELAKESEYKYKCVRPKRGAYAVEGDSSFMSDAGAVEGAGAAAETVYGDRSVDQGDEVRFSIELTRIEGLEGTLSLDIRRLKGNLRSYKFLYDTIRE
ncbi:hypothetical protein M422DRAFT_100952, partial [Sphaerobolus stellatus SS14]